MHKMPVFVREAVALVVLVFFFSCSCRQAANSGLKISAALTFAPPQEVEAKVSDFASNCSLKDKTH